MINFMFKALPEINILFDQLFSKYRDNLRSLSENDIAPAVITNYQQSKASSILWLSKSEEDKIYYE